MLKSMVCFCFFLSLVLLPFTSSSIYASEQMDTNDQFRFSSVLQDLLGTGYEEDLFAIPTNKIVFNVDMIEYARVELKFPHSLWTRINVYDDRQSILDIQAKDMGYIELDIVQSWGDLSEDVLVPRYGTYEERYIYIHPETSYGIYGLKAPEELADSIMGSSKNVWDACINLMNWFNDNIEVNIYSNNVHFEDIINDGQGSEIGMLIMFSNLCRLRGIPTKYVAGARHINGIFIQYVWLEVWTGSKWVAIDPIRGSLYPGALLIKLCESYDLHMAIVKLNEIWNNLSININDYVRTPFMDSSRRVIEHLGDGYYVNSELGFRIDWNNQVWTADTMVIQDMKNLIFYYNEKGYEGMHEKGREEVPHVLFSFCDVRTGIDIDIIHLELLTRVMDKDKYRTVPILSKLPLDNATSKWTRAVSTQDEETIVVATIIVDNRLFTFVLWKSKVLENEPRLFKELELLVSGLRVFIQ